MTDINTAVNLKSYSGSYPCTLADKLRLQYREFMRRLGQLAPTLNDKYNTQIFGLFLDQNLDHFNDIESVLSVLASAGVAMGLECCGVLCAICLSENTRDSVIWNIDSTLVSH